MQTLALAFRQRRVRTIRVMLQPADNFGEGVAIVFRATESIDDPLKAQVHRNRSDVDWAVFGDIIRWRNDRGRNRHGVPNVFRRVITDLDAIRAAGVQH